MSFECRSVYHLSVALHVAIYFSLLENSLFLMVFPRSLHVVLRVISMSFCMSKNYTKIFYVLHNKKSLRKIQGYLHAFIFLFDYLYLLNAIYLRALSFPSGAYRQIFIFSAQQNILFTLVIYASLPALLALVP